jgi:esterase/lipase
VKAAVYLVFGTADQLVDESSRRAMMEQAQPHHRVDVFEGLSHSTWTVAEADVIVERSVRFLKEAFNKHGVRSG